MTQKNSKVVVTDGYHFTKEFEVIFHHIHTYYFKVVCAIDDFQLWAGFSFLSISYMVGFFSGIFFLKLISFFPVVYFLFLYYINKKEFIQIQAT